MAFGSPPYDSGTFLSATLASASAGALLAAAVACRSSSERELSYTEDSYADPAVVAVLPSSAFAVPHLMIAVLSEHGLNPLPLDTSCSLLRLGYATTISLEVPRQEWKSATKLLREHGFEKYLCASD